MSNPILSVIEQFDRPPQFIRIDKRLNKAVGEEIVVPVRFVIHEEDEAGMTLRFVEMNGEGNDEAPENGSPRAGNGTIVPSPSA